MLLLNDVASIGLVAGRPFPGDVNLDFEINVVDATLVLRSIAGLVKLTEEQFALADAVPDRRINVTDAIAILRRSIGL